jgi:hypothetical protein
MVGNALTLKMPSAQCLMPRVASRSFKERRFPRRLNLERWFYQRRLDFFQVFHWINGNRAFGLQRNWINGTFPLRMVTRYNTLSGYWLLCICVLNIKF